MNYTPSKNYKGRFVCNGCLCLVSVQGKRCANQDCKFYEPGPFGVKKTVK